MRFLEVRSNSFINRYYGLIVLIRDYLGISNIVSFNLTFSYKI